MPVIPEAKVSKRARDFFEKGMAAMERDNIDYAMDMFRTAIETEPGFLKARKYLRAASIKKFKDSKGGQITHVLSTISSLSGLIKGTIALKTGKADKALGLAENLLMKDPLNILFIKLLGCSAEAAGMPEIAVQTLEITIEFYPENGELLMWLGKIYMRMEQTKEAQDIFSRLADLRPNDGAVKTLLKNAMAAGAMSKGWSQESGEGGGAYDLVRDAGEAAVLEQEGKASRGKEGTELLINETLRKIEREPKNVNYVRKLASLYVEAGEFDKAMETLLSNKKLIGDDAQVDQAIADVRIKQFNRDIKVLQEKGDIKAADAVKAEKDEFIFENTRSVVERYPNDLNLRYQYAVQLFEHGMYNEAIQEFQQAQKNAQRRGGALYYMGMCFREKSQFDMAREQLEKALAETTDMNDLKKGVLYELGLVAEAMGDTEKAVSEYYKEIYQADIGYRDVAAKIEQAYRR